MKYKKTIIISLSLIVFYFTMYSLRSTSFGYMISYLYESSFFSDSTYKSLNQKIEGDAPGEFHFAFDVKRTDIEIIPGLLYYRSCNPKRLNIAYRFSEDLADYQYLDFSRLELVLENGKKESLLPPSRPFRVHLKEHGNASSFRLYEAGKLKPLYGRRDFPQRTEFRLSGRPPSKQVTLIAEGTLYRGTGEGRPFRQTAVWQLVKTRELQVFGYGTFFVFNKEREEVGYETVIPVHLCMSAW
jgi:hypothetical protein